MIDRFGKIPDETARLLALNVLKIDADPITGDGGDDDYDETRYALASRPGVSRSNWKDQEVKAFSKATLLHEMERRKSRLGLATLCVSGGLGGAMLVERVTDGSG